MPAQASTPDRRPAVVAVVLMSLLLLLAPIRLAHTFFKIAELREPTCYLFAGVVIPAWGLVMLLVWRTRPLERYLKIDLDRRARR